MVGGPGIDIDAVPRDAPEFVDARQDLDDMVQGPKKIAQKVGKLAGIRQKKAII